jgi:endoglucanase
MRTGKGGGSMIGAEHATRIIAARSGRLALLVVLVMAAGGLHAATARSAPAPSSAFVRVNQVGYPSTGSKRAFLMASVVETGAAFTVTNASGVPVFSGSVGPNLGSWSSTYSNVYALDFDAVTTAGSYTISVSGPVPATSPSFRIDTGANVYGTPLANALSFYQTERDGPDFIPNALRTAPGHLNDQNAMTYLTPHVSPSGRFSGDLTPLGVSIDASGGWWDAGDYIKGVQTLGYTTDLLLAGVRDFPAQMGAGSATSNFTAEARFGTDWLLRMWDDPSRTFYYQVGIGTGNARTVGDHDLWRLPQADDTFGGTDPLYRYIRNRPVFRAGPPGSLISPNLAGRSAAAFGLCFQVFKTSDPPFANRCLLAGQHIFDLADTAPTGDLTTYIPFSFYPETEWRSDLELGAVELYLAVAGGPLGQRLHHQPRGCRRHPQPLRRQRAGPLRAAPGDRPGRQPTRAGGHPGRAAGGHAQGPGRRVGAGGR